MGRISLADLEKYGNSSGGSYFSLKNDKDTAKVRIMIDNEDDMDNYIFSCHEVQVDDRTRWVNCLREHYNDPLSDCPLCQARKKAVPRIYIPLYNIDAEEVQVWERGKKMGAKLAYLCSRYAKKGPLVRNVFEVVRVGKARDTNTDYDFFQEDEDDTTIEDLGEIPQILGRYVLDKSADDMNYYLEEGEFPPVEDDEDEGVQRRGKRDSDDSEDDRPARRTPATSKSKDDSRRRAF